GASSTFLASRIRALAKAGAVDLTAIAVSEQELEAHLPADAMLVGPHLADRFDSLVTRAGGLPAALLAADAFGPAGAASALELAQQLLRTTGSATPSTTEGPTHG
ncbi:MAG: hypothetical protein ABJB03_13160, partial [Rhodoglobus sp.]